MPETIIALSILVQVNAGDTTGVAVACSASSEGMRYLVVPYSQAGPPIWVHEGDVENAHLVPASIRQT